MRNPENEILYDGKIDGVEGFTKEYNGINRGIQGNMQEVWDTGADAGNIAEKHADDVKNK